MQAYVIRRLLLVIPALFLVTVIVFFLARLVPGDVIDMMLAEQGSAVEIDRAAIEHKLGLDVPIFAQYGRWLGVVPHPDTGFSGLLQGDLGKSLWTNRPVLNKIIDRLPVSFEVALIALVTALLISLPIGIYSAIRQDTWGDYITRSVAIACIALPPFWLGTLVMVFPSIWWRWAPPLKFVPFFQNPIQNLRMFIIPGVILGMFISGVTMRMTRTMMLEVLRQDYIRTAWSKGLSERIVIFRHALKNALIPVVTIVGLQLCFLIGGAIVIEQIFCLPGVGILLIQAINDRDYPVLSGINLIIATLVLLINLGVDLTYAYLDPRVHYK